MATKPEKDWLVVAVETFGPQLANTIRERAEGYEDPRWREVANMAADFVQKASDQPELTADILRAVYDTAAVAWADRMRTSRARRKVKARKRRAKARTRRSR